MSEPEQQSASTAPSDLYGVAKKPDLVRVVAAELGRCLSPCDGSVDATPLFVVLAGYYAIRTGDYDFIRELWPSIERALAWIDGPGDSDGDGFVDYKRGAETGLANQGWKDSFDSVFHADGRLAEGPIALDGLVSLWQVAAD